MTKKFEEHMLTPWFPPEVHPSVPGVYEVKMNECFTYYSDWDGKKFGYRIVTYLYDDPVKEAIRLRNKLTYAGDENVWRGLTKETFHQLIYGHDTKK